ncbi:MAG: hypothetical protein OXH46_10960 [Gemmatimonadetes bacterium]|nr:hypothetical protein [Gemmatimonadota bacterium]
MLAMVPLLVIGATVLHMLQEREGERRQLEQALQLLHERTEDRWARFTEDFRLDSLPATRRSVDEAVDQAFVPVYAGIDPFLDWHYSFWGQSTQLILLLLGEIGDLTGTEMRGLEEEVASRLLEGLEDRMGKARERVDSAMREEIGSRLDGWFGQEEASLPLGRAGVEYGRRLLRVRQATTRRLVVSVGPLAVGTQMTDVATSVGVRAVANRLARRLPALVRTSVARWMPPWVVVALRAGPTILAGMIIDFVVRRIDEWLNREELRQELIEMVDTERERAKSELVEAADRFKLDAIDALGVFIPAELDRRPAA